MAEEVEWFSTLILNILLLIISETQKSTAAKKPGTSILKYWILEYAHTYLLYSYIEIE